MHVAFKEDGPPLGSGSIQDRLERFPRVVHLPEAEESLVTADHGSFLAREGRGGGRGGRDKAQNGPMGPRKIAFSIIRRKGPHQITPGPPCPSFFPPPSFSPRGP